MATVADMSSDQLVRAITEGNKELIRQLGGGSNRPMSSSSNSVIDVTPLTNKMGAVFGVTDQLVNNFGRLAQGSMTAGDALGIFTGVISKTVPGFGAALGGMTTGVYETGNIFNESLKTASKSGAYWGNDLGKYSEQITGARMTMDEMNAAVAKSGTSMNQLGLNMDQAMTRYAYMAKSMQELDITTVLERTGIGIDEFNTSLQQNISTRKLSDFNELATQKKVIDSTIALVTIQDDLSRLTGLSRDQQRDDLKRVTEKVTVTAAMMQMDEDQKSQFLATISQLRELGPGVQDLAAEIATGGVRTKEGSEKLAAMGTAAASFQEAIRMQSSTDPAERAKSSDALKIAMAEITANQKSSTYLDQVRLGAGAVTDAMGKQLQENAGLGARTSAEYTAAKLGKTVAEVEAMEANAKKASRLGVTPEGTPAAGAETARAYNEANRAIKDVAAGTGVVFSELNTEGGKLLRTVTGFNDLYKVRTQSDMAETIKSPVTAVTDVIANPLPWLKRKNGSLGETGQFIEDFGTETPTLLHGKEGVITEDQFKGLADYFTKSTTNLGINTEIKDQKGSNPVTGLMDQINSSFNNIKIDPIQEQETPINGMIDQVSNWFSSGVTELDTFVSKLTASSNQTDESLQNLTSQQTKVASEVGQTSPTIADFEKLVTQMYVTPAETSTKPEATVESKDTVSMSDLKDELVQLNKSIKELITHTNTVSDNISSQTRATKSLSGNRLL
jgi:hypothetical protein